MISPGGLVDVGVILFGSNVPPSEPGKVSSLICGEDIFSDSLVGNCVFIEDDDGFSPGR
jgi:hypothetical protein